jgi:hypothetical protein
VMYRTRSTGRLSLLLVGFFFPIERTRHNAQKLTNQ